MNDDRDTSLPSVRERHVEMTPGQRKAYDEAKENQRRLQEARREMQNSFIGIMGAFSIMFEDEIPMGLEMKLQTMRDITGRYREKPKKKIKDRSKTKAARKQRNRK